MPFIDKDDLTQYIKEDQLDDIIENNDDNLTTHIDYSLALIRSYLDDRFDVDAIFGESGSNRHPIIKKIAVNIAIYELHNLVNPRFIPESRRVNFEDALSMLDRIAKGKLCNDLPEIDEDEDPTGFARFGADENDNTY